MKSNWGDCNRRQFSHRENGRCLCEPLSCGHRLADQSELGALAASTTTRLTVRRFFAAAGAVRGL